MCVCKTATRRRRQARLDKRYKIRKSGIEQAVVSGNKKSKSVTAAGRKG